MENIVIRDIKNKKLDFLVNDKFKYQILVLLKDNDFDIWTSWLENKNINVKNFYKETVKNYLNNINTELLYNISLEEYKLITNILFNDVGKDVIYKRVLDILKYYIIPLEEKDTCLYFNEDLILYDYLINKQEIIIKIKEIIQEYKEKCKKLIKFVDIISNQNKIYSYIKELELLDKTIIIKNIFYDKLFKTKSKIILNNNNTIYLPIKDKRVINLKTLEIRTRTKEDYFSYEIPCNYLDYYKNIPRYILDLFSKNTIEDIQRLLGYCFTGYKKENIFIIFHGSGSNGKTTFLNIINFILGDLSNSIKLKDFNTNDIEELIKSKNLQYKRLFTLDECKKNDKLDDTNIKILCDKSYSKLIISTNFIPEFDVNSFAMTRRLIYIPFENKFVSEPKTENEKLINKDLELEFLDNNILLDELFTWVVNGSNLYINNGLLENKFEEIKKDLIYQLDPIEQFLKEKTVYKEDNKIKASILYNEYKNWCKLDSIIEVISITKFGMTLKEKNLKTKKYKDGTYYLNLSLI